MTHLFLFSPKDWLGEGTLKLSMVDEELEFYTRWHHKPKDDEGTIIASQEVQIKGIPDVMQNEFIISEITPNRFQVELENAAVGRILGKGIIKDELLAWELRDPESGFEGFEFYELQEDGSYLMRAEYATPDQYRTVIQGKIWEKEDEEKND